MKYFSIFCVIFLFSCKSQTISEKTNVEFEDIYHHYISLTQEKYLIIDSQEEMRKVYQIINEKYEGNRKPPIPQVNSEEKYVIFKPILKNSNDVEIVNVEMGDKILFINTKPSQNFDINKNSRISPHILIKIYSKQTPKKIIINTQL